MKMETKSFSTTVPSGLTVTAAVPSNTDLDLMDVLFKAILGALSVIELVQDEESKRAFLVRYVSAVVGETNGLAHSSQLSNQFNANSAVEKAVEDLLKSLHKRS